MEAEQEDVFTSVGEEVDTACRSLARNGEDKLQVFFFLYCTVCFCCLFEAAFVLDGNTGMQLAC